MVDLLDLPCGTGCGKLGTKVSSSAETKAIYAPADSSSRYLPALNMLGAFWTIGGGIAWAVSFGVMAPKHDANFVFKLFINNSGYTSSGWVFIMSFYTPMYGLYGTDGMMHLVEEMRDASKEAPRVVVWSMIFCSITSWLGAILMMWCAGDWETYMNASQPYMNWFMDILQSIYGGGVFCALIMIGLNFFIIVGTNLAGSRLAWSMARDKAFPFSDYLAVVNKRFGIPLRAMLAIVVIDLIIGLIVLGSDLAFESIISGGGVTLQVGYVTPVIVSLCRGRANLPPRPHFDLGRWGYPINIISVCWSLIIIMMYSFPLYVPITIPNISWMNWSCLIAGATIIFPGAYWIFSARHKYIKDGNSVLSDNVVVIDGQAKIAAEVILEK